MKEVSEAKRQTRRTSRMLDEINRCREENVEVYFANYSMAQSIKVVYETEYGVSNHVKWMSCNGSFCNREKFDSFLTSNKPYVFIDHSCLEYYYGQVLNFWCKYDTIYETIS